MNPYIKQFPDLMAGKKIMYVHGFLSSAQSGTVKMLQELMPNATLSLLSLNWIFNVRIRTCLTERNQLKFGETDDNIDEN